ncbi:MAG: hypothetical protein MZV70_52710 [Desulfobacterales bacterium]|nr:hypothetical protein [Desulfobacterales bacterium]
MAGPKIVNGARERPLRPGLGRDDRGDRGGQDDLRVLRRLGREHHRQHAHQRGGPRERQEGPPQRRPGRPHLERHAGAEPALRRARARGTARVRGRFGIREDKGRGTLGRQAQRPR